MKTMKYFNREVMNQAKYYGKENLYAIESNGKTLLVTYKNEYVINGYVFDEEGNQSDFKMLKVRNTKDGKSFVMASRTKFELENIEPVEYEKEALEDELKAAKSMKAKLEEINENGDYQTSILIREFVIRNLEKLLNGFQDEEEDDLSEDQDDEDLQDEDIDNADISVWVGHLGACNAGYLIGKWITLPKSDDELSEAFNEIQREAAKVGEHGDELEVFDINCNVEGIFSEISRLGLYEMNELAERLEALEEYELDELVAIIEVSDSIFEALKIHEEGRAIILDEIEDLEDLGRAWVEVLGALEVPPHLENYVDFEAIGRDLSFSGWTLTSNNKAVCIY